MSGHEIPYEFPQNRLIADPGNAGTLLINDNHLAVCPIKTAGAETRTIPAPSIAGGQLLVYGDTLVGAATITITGGVSGLSSVVLTTAGDLIRLEAITIAGTLKWQMQSPIKGAALTAAKPTFTIADAEGSADNAIAAVINSSAYGFSNAAELITLLYKVQNLHTRQGEMEARLQAAGIIG